MRKILPLLIMMGSLGMAMGQASRITHIDRIEIDGTEIKTRYRVFIFSDKWIEAKQKGGGFILPEKLRSGTNLSVLITFGKHKLAFSNIHISKFNERWTVGIDKKPFSEEFATAEEAKTIKRIYYIKFKGIGMGTDYVIKVR